MTANIVPWTTDTKFAYLVHLDNKFVHLNENVELQKELKNSEVAKLELLDFILQRDAIKLTEEDKNIIVSYFPHFLTYPLSFISNNSIYQNYKLDICNQDEAFNKVDLHLIQKFRLENKNEKFFEDPNLSITKFNDFLKKEYNQVKNKTEKNEDETYFTENFIHFALSWDLFVLGTINLEETYDYPMKQKFNLSKEELEALYQKYVNLDNLDTCQVESSENASSQYIYTMMYFYNGEDEELTFEDALKQYLFNEIDLYAFKQQAVFYDIQITKHDVKQETVEFESGISFSHGYKVYEDSPET